MPVPDSFATARLRAERLTPDHHAAMRRFHSDPAVMATLGGVRDEAKTAAYMEWNLRHWDQHGFGIWMLRDAASDRIAGLGVLRHLLIEGADEVEVGYGFHPEYWGRGLATEIAVECVRLAAEELGLASVVAITLPTNAASQRVMTKAGLSYERDVVHEGTGLLLFRRVL